MISRWGRGNVDLVRNGSKGVLELTLAAAIKFLAYVRLRGQRQEILKRQPQLDGSKYLILLSVP